MPRLPTLSLVLLALVPLTASAQVAKIFTDKGSTWIRSDNKSALVVGAEFDVVVDDKGAKKVGKAVIMEVNGMLARVNVDEDATKGGGRFVVLAGAQGGGASPVNATPEAPSPLRELVGKVKYGGFGITVQNLSPFAWTRCKLYLPPDRLHTFDDDKEIRSDDSDSVRYPLFKPAPGFSDQTVREARAALMVCKEGRGYLPLAGAIMRW